MALYPHYICHIVIIIIFDSVPKLTVPTQNEPCFKWCEQTFLLLCLREEISWYCGFLFLRTTSPFESVVYSRLSSGTADQ